MAEVQNEGRRSVDGGTIEFYAADELIRRRALGTLQPGEKRGMSFFASFDALGDTRLEARLSGDDLAIDNRRFSVVTVSDRVGGSVRRRASRGGAGDPGGSIVGGPGGSIVGDPAAVSWGDPAAVSWGDPAAVSWEHTTPYVHCASRRGENDAGVRVQSHTPRLT